MKTAVAGLTGWWSNLIPYFRKPIELPFEKLKNDENIVTKQFHWREWEKASRWLLRRDADRRIILGHSYGASAGTHACHWLYDKSITVDLFIAEDQGLDSWFIKDKPIPHSVKEVDEYRVCYEQIRFVKGWDGNHNYYKLPCRFFNHTSVFTDRGMVEKVAQRIREVANW